MNIHIVSKTFGRDIYEGKITIEEANEYQTDVLAEIMNFRKYTKARRQEKDKKKKLLLKTCTHFFRVEKLLDAFESKIFSTKSKGSGILNPDQSIQ